MDREGYINRFISYFNNLRGIFLLNKLYFNNFSLVGSKNQKNNIFIPTGTLQLFTHLNKIVPNHHAIMADFDSFILPKASYKGK